jgi:hypothetical protein
MRDYSLIVGLKSTSRIVVRESVSFLEAHVDSLVDSIDEGAHTIIFILSRVKLIKVHLDGLRRYDFHFFCWDHFESKAALASHF